MYAHDSHSPLTVCDDTSVLTQSLSFWIFRNLTGFAYIEFNNEAAVANAVKLDGSELKGRTLKVTPKRVNIPGFNRGGGRGRGRGGGGRGDSFRGGYNSGGRGGFVRGSPGRAGYRGGFRGRGGGGRGRAGRRGGGFQPY